MSEQPKDNPEALGSLDKRELALIVVAASIGLVMVTYAVAIIIALASAGPDAIVITGTIDLSKVEGVVFTIVGAGSFAVLYFSCKIRNSKNLNSISNQ